MKYCRLLILVLVCLFFAPVLFSQEAYVIEVEGKKIPFRFDPKRDVLVIEGEFLKQIPFLNLPQLLSIVANMNFVARGIFQADPQMMGFNQEQIVIMVNGAALNNAQTGHHNFSLPFEVDQIQRIEIMRGGSSRYGFSGAGGLVNIVTAGANRIKAGLSSFETYSSSIDLSVKDFSLSAGMNSTGGYSDGLDGKKTYLQSKARIALSNGLLDVWGGWLSSKFGANYFYGPYPSYEELDRLLGIVSWNSPLSGNMLLDVRLTTQYSLDEYKLYREDPQFYTNVHNTFANTLEAGIKHDGTRHSIYAGASAYFDSINSSGVRSGQAALALGDRRRSLFSFVGECGMDIGKFFMNAGAQACAGTYDSLSAHALAGAWLDKSLRISGSVARNVRIPTYTELYYSDPVHRSNPYLSPETGLSGALSLEFRRQKWDGGLKAFLSRADNLIEWEMKPGESVWTSVNLRKGSYYGADVRIGYEEKPVLVKILYTFQKAEFEDQPYAKSLKYHYYFPEHSLSILAVGRLADITISGSIKAEKEKLSGKARFYLNMKAGIRLGKALLTFEGLNLFDTRLEKIPGLLEPPRSFGLGLAYEY